MAPLKQKRKQKELKRHSGPSRGLGAGITCMHTPPQWPGGVLSFHPPLCEGVHTHQIKSIPKASAAGASLIIPELTPNPLGRDQDKLICIAALCLDRALRLHLPLRPTGCPELSAFCRQQYAGEMMGRSMPPTPVLSWAFWEAAGKRTRRLECRLVPVVSSCGRSGFWGCNTSRASASHFSLTLEHASSQPFVPNPSCASACPFR